MAYSPIMNTHPRGTPYFSLPPIASLQPPAPMPVPGSMPMSMSTPRATQKEEDLSAISKARVDIGQEKPFNLSNSLKHALETGGPEKDDEIYTRILAECAKYADERKELVRGALKKRQRDSGIALSTIDKSKLRSRREAKVHRVKEREYDTALKDCIRWFISQRGNQRVSEDRMAINHNHNLHSNINTNSNTNSISDSINFTNKSNSHRDV